MMQCLSEKIDRYGQVNSDGRGGGTETDGRTKMGDSSTDLKTKKW